jgi:hypothetical protein
MVCRLQAGNLSANQACSSATWRHHAAAVAGWTACAMRLQWLGCHRTHPGFGSLFTTRQPRHLLATFTNLEADACTKPRFPREACACKTRNCCPLKLFHPQNYYSDVQAGAACETSNHQWWFCRADMVSGVASDPMASHVSAAVHLLLQRGLQTPGRPASSAHPPARLAKLVLLSLRYRRRCRRGPSSRRSSCGNACSRLRRRHSCRWVLGSAGAQSVRLSL